MNSKKIKSISIYGATGSVGKSSVKVIKHFKELFIVDTIVANSRATELAKIAKVLLPKIVIIQDESKENILKNLLKNYEIEVQSGCNAILQASKRNIDIFIAAISGIAGLKSIINCIPHVKILALANKESLVCAGEELVKEANNYNCKIIPLDSEHNAIFQLLNVNEKKFFNKIIITCSGGPFLGYKKEQLRYITPEKALKHPVWNMGKKISIDSATLMNKGLELIEASYLFGIEESRIDILIHPQSIIHGLIEYIDGSLKACMGIPDMRIPISFALNWPERKITMVKSVDFKKIKSLTFDELDENVFPAIKISRNVINQGGTTPAILNAANEVVVKAFLDKRINFVQITEIIEEVLSKINILQKVSLDNIIISDRDARNLTESIIKKVKI